MRGPGTMAFKQGFLKNLLLSLQASASSTATSVQERKRAIKSSAEIAMATARGGGARWPQAILASSSSRPPPCRLRPGKAAQRCRKIVRRCCHMRRRDDGAVIVARTAMVSSREIAKKLVRKRTMILRRMIPGGELLDEVALLREAMDYVAHLHAQVEVLRRISKTVR